MPSLSRTLIPVWACLVMTLPLAAQSIVPVPVFATSNDVVPGEALTSR